MMWFVLGLVFAAPPKGIDAVAPSPPEEAAEDPISAEEEAKETALSWLERAREGERPPQSVFDADVHGDVPGVEGPTYVVEAVLEVGEAPSWSVDQVVFFDNPTEVPWEEVVFRVFPAAVSEVEVRAVGGDGTKGALDGTLLVVDLAEPLLPGEQGRVELGLTMPVPDVPVFHNTPGQVNGTHVGAFGAWSDIVQLGYGLPLLTHPTKDGQDRRPLPSNGEHNWHQAADFHLSLDVPSGWTVAATGTRVELQEGEDRNVHTLVAAAVRELAIAAGETLEVVEAERDGVTVRVFHPRAVDDQLVFHTLTGTARSLEVFSEAFGPYPWAELDVVMTSLNFALGVEYPGLVLINTQVMASDAAHTTAHEVAHQWWYGRVGNDVRDLPWLDEGLASWSASYLYNERTEARPVAEVRAELAGSYRAMADAGVEDAPADQPSETYSLHQYGTVVYGKSALFWELVRQQIGTEAFLSVLRGYVEDHAPGDAEPGVLVEAMAEAAEDPEVVRQLHQRWIREAHAMEDPIEIETQQTDASDEATGNQAGEDESEEGDARGEVEQPAADPATRDSDNKAPALEIP